MTRARNPLRLKAKRWSGYASIFHFQPSPTDPVEVIESVGYPADMVADWEDYSWRGRPVQGTPYRETPILWTPHHAARAMDMTLSDYIAAGYAPVLPSGAVPTRRPKAVVYQSYAYGAVSPGTEVDVVALAVAGLEDALRAKGVSVLRINTPYYKFFDAGANQGRGAAVAGNYHGLVSVTAPISEIGHLWEVGPLSGNDNALVYRRLNGSPYEGGEILYVTAISLGNLDWPYVEIDQGAFLGDTATYAYWPELRARDVAMLNQMAALHDRCGFYLAVAGFDDFPVGAPNQAWSHTKDTVLPALQSDVPSLDFGTYTAGSRAGADGVEPVAPLTALIRAKIQSFFGV